MSSRKILFGNLGESRTMVKSVNVIIIAFLLMTGIGVGQNDPFALDLPEFAVCDRVLSPVYKIPSNSKYVAAELEGPGCINHIWVVLDRPKLSGALPTRPLKVMPNRKVIIRIYFDDAQTPNVEAPLGDFFGLMHGADYYPINTEFLSSQPWNGYNCYFKMPFAKSARIELETGGESVLFVSQVDWHRYPEQEMEEDRRFCGAWRRENRCQSYGEEFFMLDVNNPGQLIGFVYGVRLYDNEDRWSHAGAENLYIDGLGRYPIHIRGLGGEDTFGTAYGGAVFNPTTHLYASMPFYVHEDIGEARPAQRVVGYRFFVKDPIQWHESLHMRFASMQNDICSMVYWYQEGDVHSGVKMPSDFKHLLPNKRVSREETMSELPDSGSWKVGGPFENKDDSGISKALKGTLLAEVTGREQWITDRKAYHGFIDFNHLWRPHKFGVGVHYDDKVSVAQTVLKVDRNMTASVRLAWDDHLVMQVNGDKPIDMGGHKLFKQKTVKVPLKKGDNIVTLTLNNSKGLNNGGWAFAFKATAPDGNIIVPESPQ